MVVSKSQLKKMVSKYKYRDLTVCETVNVITLYKDLKPVLDSYVFNDGNSRELMNLTGTIPVPYRNNTYSIPICLWLLDTNPYNPPICFIKPTSSMTIKTGKHVDANGKIYLPYLHEWKHPQSDLLGLIQVMIVVFGDESPVFSRPTVSASYPPYQAVEPSNTSYVPGLPSGISAYPSEYPPNPSGYPGCPYRPGGQSQETPGDGQPPALPPKQSKKNSWSQIHYSHSQQDLENHINETFDVPSSPEKSTPNGGIPHDNLVLIRMKPDENGRFGFNVKGGCDQKMPVIVSRVAPGTPADLCVPRLNEGDQVVLINGRDIAEHTHDQVVLLIKASCERHSGELVLLVRPNAVYDVVEEKLENEPDFQYIPEKAPLDSIHQDDHSLRESMIQLAEGLITGTVLTQFDQLYRKKPGMTMCCAKLPQNISKNRYRDISPYDATRVILKGNEDYINANYINMEIPSSRIINQYIACQGPLPHTCTDFWQMTWEQGSSMVVMLTTQVERGRVKCHQYWPDPTGSSSYGCYQVTCHSEEGNTAYVFRKMTLFNQEVGERGAYWLELLCSSAGIGRTGVLITMETAMCLIECNQPVYPLDIVRTMRDQRAMMIQTPSQYRFVCEAILKVYEEGFVKPLMTSSNK
ncbi:hypothetical protein MJG53_002844 [Ovis ammon polii x Ovis aries]|uniref:Uncharacterized protein n=1 Tax=Ovis ammon polii x Ovis aries TaxID=2918886 RepID=A0ACB9VEN6_9CETA|nr:hypothetical protein MJT46_004182 [Ovis ammon polii x Ovis aries]KAI4588436.1 hypothetical protein MJG53_002844 [Ovis ammon polii x Ovis aries]